MTKRFMRISKLDFLPMKPYQGWSDLQLDEALQRPELFRGNTELYASCLREAVKRGLGSEEDYHDSPFPLMVTKTPLSLFNDPLERHHRKHKKEEREKKLRELLMEITEIPEKKEGAFSRLLRLATTLDDNGCDTSAFDRQFELYLERNIERTAHFIPSKDTNTPPMWKLNMDYAPEEGSPYFGSVSEFLKRFPGGIKEWREWRKKTKEQRERRHRIASLMPNVTAEDEGLETFLKEAWEQERQAHYVPEGGDDVEKLGDKEPKIWSDDPKWKSIDEFLKAHREHYGQDADDAALKAARDFVRYWQLTLKKPKTNEKK